MAQEYCSSFSGNPVLPPSSNLQCGLQTLNRSLMESCCIGTPQQYKTCFFYCEPQGEIRDFVSCVSRGDNLTRTDAFCESSIQSTVRTSVGNGSSGGSSSGNSGGGTSSGIRGVSSPKISTVVILTLMMSFFLAAPASATLIRSLDPAGVSRRAPDTCTFTEDSHFNRTGDSLQVSDSFDCSGTSFCTFGTSIDTGLTSNNRTLNGKSAAEAEYDAFFEILGNSTDPKRLWPAMSGASLYYTWVSLAGSSTSVGWTVLQVS